MTLFAERLKMGRQAKGLSKADFAALMDVEPSTVTRWEKGGGIEEDRIPQIASILGRSTEWLTGIIDSDVEDRLKELESKLNQGLSPQIQAQPPQELLDLIATVPVSRIPALIRHIRNFIGAAPNETKVTPPVSSPARK